MSSFIPQTFEDLACYWYQVHAITHKSPSSLKRDQGMLRNYLLPAFGNHRLKTLQGRDVVEWFARLKQGSNLSAKSCNELLGLLRKICGDGERWGFLDKDPSRAAQKLKIAEQDWDFWSVEEVQQYLGHWKTQHPQPRIIMCATLALYTGMRRGELAGLKWDCVDLEHAWITVKRSYCRIAGKILDETKSKKIRRIPINTMLLNFLRQLKLQTAHTGLVLPYFHLDHYHREFRRSAASAGLRSIRFHDLRHSFASNFLMGGGSIYDLQRILGHSSVQVTERYTHMVPDHLKGKTEVLGF